MTKSGNKFSYFVFLTWILFLSSMTCVLYGLTNLFSLFQPNSNVYLIGMVSGATGGMWGLGLTVAYDSLKEIKKGNSSGHHSKFYIMFIISIVIIGSIGFYSGWINH